MASKKVGIIIDFNYEDLEVWYPKLRFIEAGLEVVVIGVEAGRKYESKHNYPCISDAAIDQIKAEELSGLVIPGGWAPDYMRRNKLMVQLVKDMVESGKPVGAICHGAWMLCSAKVLTGRRATCFISIKDDLENAGGLYEDAAVVVDKNLITSRVPGDLPEFCKAMLAQL